MQVLQSDKNDKKKRTIIKYIICIRKKKPYPPCNQQREQNTTQNIQVDNLLHP